MSARAMSSRTLRGRVRSGLPERAPVLALVVVAVRAGADRLPPPPVVAIPRHGPFQAFLEAHLRPPAEPLDLLGAERVTAVVARAGGGGLEQGIVRARGSGGAPDDGQGGGPLRGAGRVRPPRGAAAARAGAAP